MIKAVCLIATVGVLLPAVAWSQCENPDATDKLRMAIEDVVESTQQGMPETCMQAALDWVVREYFPGETPNVVEGVADDKLGFWNPVTGKLSMAPLSEFVDFIGERSALEWYVGVLAHEMAHREQGRVTNALRIFDVTDASHERIEEFEENVRRHFRAENVEPHAFCSSSRF